MEVKIIAFCVHVSKVTVMFVKEIPSATRLTMSGHPGRLAVVKS